MARATASCSGPTRALSTSDGRRLGEQRRFGPYRTAVGFTSRWGTAEPAGHLNGSSGRWVEDQILAPLGLARDEVWITDCLNTYHRSTEVHVRIQRTYNPFATGEGLSVARLAQHPTEEDIVAEAVAERDRLLEELETARPELIITAGRAALRVMEALVRVAGERPSLRVRPGGPMLRVSRLECQRLLPYCMANGLARLPGPGRALKSFARARLVRYGRGIVSLLGAMRFACGLPGSSQG